MKWNKLANESEPQCILLCCWCANASPIAPTSNLWPSHRLIPPPAKMWEIEKLSLAFDKSLRFSFCDRNENHLCCRPWMQKLVLGIFISSPSSALSGEHESFFSTRPLGRGATIMRQDSAMSISVVFHQCSVFIVHNIHFSFFFRGVFRQLSTSSTISFFPIRSSLLFFLLVAFSHFHVSTSETMNRQTLQTPAGGIFIIVSERKCGERENYSPIRRLFGTELNHTQAPATTKIDLLRSWTKNLSGGNSRAESRWERNQRKIEKKRQDLKTFFAHPLADLECFRVNGIMKQP